MNKEPKNVDVKEIISAGPWIVVAAVLAIIIYVVPFLQIAMFIISIPIIVIGIKYDFKVQIGGTVILGLLIALIEPIYAVNVITTAGVLGIVQGYLIKRKKKNSEIILYGTLACFFGLLAYLYILNGFADFNMLEYIKVIIADSFADLNTAYGSTNTLSEKEMMTLLQMLNDTRDALIILIPTTFILLSFVSSTFNFLLAKAVLGKLKLRVVKGKFKDFRISKQGKLILFSVIFVVIVVALIDVANQNIYIVNFSSVFVLLLQINGFALIWYFSESKPNKVAFRVSCIVLFIIAPVLGGLIETIVRYGIVLLGLVDIFYDFRAKYIERKQR